MPFLMFHFNEALLEKLHFCPFEVSGYEMKVMYTFEMVHEYLKSQTSELLFHLCEPGLTPLPGSGFNLFTVSPQSQ